MSKIILEYSEEQKCFHFNYGNQPENFNTYKTLHNDIDYEIAAAFVKKVNKSFPKGNLSFDFVKDLFEGK